MRSFTFLTYVVGSFLVMGAAAQAQTCVPDTIRVEAEHFVASFDKVPGNEGGVYRIGDTDIEPTIDDGGGFQVAYMEDTETLDYQFNQKTYPWYIRVRVSSATGAGKIRITSLGNTVRPAVEIPIPNTGGWNNFVTLSAAIPGGLYKEERLLRVQVIQTNSPWERYILNLNWLELSATP